MENKSNYINLEQVAQVTGDSVYVVKSKIFDRKLMPSYHITRPVSVDIYTWVDAKDDNGPYKETEEIGVDVLFTGFVRISGARRDSGGTGKIQLCLKNYENPEEWPGTPIRLYHWNEEQARDEIIYPKKSLKISENSLIVHWDHLREYISDDPEAIDRYEELRPLLDTPVSVPLSDIRITDKMLTDYTASEGLIPPKLRTQAPPLTIPQPPMPDIKTFTQEEAAVILETDPDDVFKRMMGEYSVRFQPSIIIKTPVLMRRTEFIGGNPDDYGRGSTDNIVEEKLSGIFGIEGVRPLKWDELRLAQLTFGEWPPDREEKKHGNSSGVLLS